MHSACESAAHHEDGGSEEFQLSKDADRLVTEHGEDADHVAARRADSLFRQRGRVRRRALAQDLPQNRDGAPPPRCGIIGRFSRRSRISASSSARRKRSVFRSRPPRYRAHAHMPALRRQRAGRTRRPQAVCSARPLPGARSHLRLSAPQGRASTGPRLSPVHRWTFLLCNWPLSTSSPGSAPSLRRMNAGRLTNV